MPNALDDLRRQILRRAAKRLGFVTLLRIDPLFRETKIRDFQISLIVKQNIFWFQIAIDNIVLMQTPNSLDHLSWVKACALFWELSILPKVIEKLATVHKVHDEVQLWFGLECVV